MMRSPSSWAVAVRKPDGEIAQVVNGIDSPMARRRIWRLPVIRGVIALGESLAIGFRALAISANYAAQDGSADKDGEEVKTELSRGQLIFAFAIAIGFAVMLFKVTPALITNLLPIDTTGVFVIVEGGIRVTLFVLYLALISLLARPAPCLPVPRGRAQGDQRLRGRRRPDAGAGPAPQQDPRPLRHGLPALGDGDRDLRLRVLRPAGLVLADRHPDRAAARDRRARLRADPLRRQAFRPALADLAARAGPLAPAADDARADARPARGLDQGARGRARARG